MPNREAPALSPKHLEFGIEEMKPQFSPPPAATTASPCPALSGTIGTSGATRHRPRLLILTEPKVPFGAGLDSGTGPVDIDANEQAERNKRCRAD